MIQKYFFIVFILMGIAVISCRQDDDLSSEKNTKDFFEKKTLKEDEIQNAANRDSTNIDPKEPPKNGTHWKIGDSINVSEDPTEPPKSGTHWKIGDTIEISTDPTEPPKSGTHWKIGK
ncbi:hypothetical protein OMO38_06430 [Chryseobacterium sp. 09-1422]|uniref:Lipoprotein n=1 Tax=Chryseobacterium kimseyorum TaxID=2984028 RepID=A0ABT3HWH9_9FLAO|nr:hypothetical protein [Chryseobacterium kimseyorum]MCW3168157.1 hypothetical protein [Chryseobacterium kimseyorum]